MCILLEFSLDLNASLLSQGLKLFGANGLSQLLFAGEMALVADSEKLFELGSEFGIEDMLEEPAS